MSNELEGAIRKENVSRNITKSAIKTENQILKKKKLQEIEEMEKGDVKAESELKEEFEKLKKKYEMTRRLCELRNDDIAAFKSQIVQLKVQITQLQASFVEEYERLIRRNNEVWKLCQIRTNKLNDLRKEVGIVIEDSAENNKAEQGNKWNPEDSQCSGTKANT